MPLFEMSAEDAKQLYYGLDFALRNFYEAQRDPAVMRALDMDVTKQKEVRDRLLDLQSRLLKFCHDNGYY
jgi:seryl-tRNA(Sec) selenium transferase